MWNLRIPGKCGLYLWDIFPALEVVVEGDFIINPTGANDRLLEAGAAELVLFWTKPSI